MIGRWESDPRPKLGTSGDRVRVDNEGCLKEICEARPRRFCESRGNHMNRQSQVATDNRLMLHRRSRTNRLRRYSGNPEWAHRPDCQGFGADSAGRISVERFESTAPSYTRTGLFLGLNGHIRAYLKAHPDWEREGFTQLVQQFVEMEITAHANLAGPPISELEIDKDGKVHWLAKGACPPTQAD